MNWITDFVKPKLQSLIRRDIPENLWVKCPGCDHMLFHADLEKHNQVCYHCHYHLKLHIKDRIKLIFDDGYHIHPIPRVSTDPLSFRDTKRYTDRLAEYRQKTGYDDAVLIVEGSIEGSPAIAAIFNFHFMGGSMGMAAGQAFLDAAMLAVKTKSSFIAISASGGARMQEGILSLMQMPRTIVALNKVRSHGLPYITVLTDPTTGGVSASFAMLGDIAIAEKGCIIGFAGARVIEEIIRQKLPDGFQTAEYLLEHGMVDIVSNRNELKSNIGKIIKILRHEKK